MKNSNTETVRAEMEKLLAARASELETLQAQIDQETEEMRADADDMEAATDNGDLQSYQAAKSRMANAADAKEMHESRVRRLTQEPLITESEYARMKSDIFSEMDANVETAKKQLKRLCDQIASLADDLQQAGQDANATLKAVQRDLYRNADRKLSNNGKQYIDRELEYKRHYDVLDWAFHATSYEMYKAMLLAERRKQQEG